MDSELRPFLGATVRAAKLGDARVLNLVDPELEERYYSAYCIYPAREAESAHGEARGAETSSEATARYACDRIASSPVDTQKWVRSILSHAYFSAGLLIYIISPTAMLPLLQRAEETLHPPATPTKKRKARRRHDALLDHFVASCAAIPADRGEEEVKVGGALRQTHPAFNLPVQFASILRQRGSDVDGYSMMAVVEMQFAPPSLARFPLTSAALFLARNGQDGIAFTSGSGGISLELRSAATTEPGFVRYIEETVEEVSATPETPLTQHLMRRMLLTVYLNPLLVCRYLTLGREPLPTTAWVEKEQVRIVGGADEYARHFSDLLIRCNCTIAIPPMSSESAFRLLARAEVALAPKLLDQEFLLEQNGMQHDTLFEKLYQRLPDSEEKVRPSRHGRDRIVFTYGALLDAGQIFTYGECAEMMDRIRRLA